MFNLPALNNNNSSTSFKDVIIAAMVTHYILAIGGKTASNLLPFTTGNRRGSRGGRTFRALQLFINCSTSEAMALRTILDEHSQVIAQTLGLGEFETTWVVNTSKATWMTTTGMLEFAAKIKAGAVKVGDQVVAWEDLPEAAATAETEIPGFLTGTVVVTDNDTTPPVVPAVVADDSDIPADANADQPGFLA